jgi:hypothetical protein
MSASSDWAKAAAAGLSLWLLVAPTAVGAACLAGYESLCAELKAPYQKGGVGSEAGTGPLGQRPPQFEENSDFGITQHGEDRGNFSNYVPRR